MKWLWKKNHQRWCQRQSMSKVTLPFFFFYYSRVCSSECCFFFFLIPKRVSTPCIVCQLQTDFSFLSFSCVILRWAPLLLLAPFVTVLRYGEEEGLTTTKQCQSAALNNTRVSLIPMREHHRCETNSIFIFFPSFLFRGRGWFPFSRYVHSTFCIVPQCSKDWRCLSLAKITHNKRQQHRCVSL